MTGEEGLTPNCPPGPQPTEAERQIGDGDTGLPTEPAAQPTQTASTNAPTNNHHPDMPAPSAQPRVHANPGTHQPRTIADYFNPPAHNKKNKILRANIRIGSYNIRGGGSRQTSNKWEQLNQIMRDNRIGILAVQETHLTRAEVNRLNGLFEKRLLIINSSLHRRTNAAGVAIILNKQWTAWSETHHWEVVPGRALLVQIPWKNSRETTRTILAIYAPNDPVENKELWKTLQRAFRNDRLPNPDFMIGDFNIVEDALDRIPAHEDDANAVEELRNLKNQLNLMDGWRAENGDEKAYSYLQSTTFSQSRIDRIYINPELFPSTREWEISHDVSLSDHNLVSVQYFDPGAPKIGRGRWSIPQYAVDDEKFIKDIKPLLDHALKPVGTEETRPITNPQQRLKNLKNEIITLARKYVSEKVPESKKKIAVREKELKKVLNDPGTTEEHKKERAAELELEIRKLQLHHHLSTRERIHLKFAKENELIGKTWINVNKDIRGRDQILALQKPESERGGLVYNSTKMAEIARKYHSEIQAIGRCYDAAEDERKKAIDEALNALETTLTNEESSELNEPLTSAEIRRAVYDSANDKSAGLDGIPTEVWKALTRNPKHIKEDEDEEEIWDAARLLRETYNDVIENGILPETDFASGWMSPIFKKKDKTKIENYRPITVLNADYKIMTKTLTARITLPALKLIHTDQAGFMKGRRIENQTDLIRTMIEYGQNDEAKGLLIFLDQEKAYDKILHDFLYETLERMNFPPNFIKSVKAIYGSAWTRVIINGCISDAFKVTRGVRQGDPLSCLLFNFAIESLACMVRKSHLKGFHTPNTQERLIISMFADDTTVYLAEQDKLEDLTAILERWCIASGAKFNVDKTEIIPIGNKEYRDMIIRTRGEEEGRTPIPISIKIAKQGEPVRALGAFVGNGVENGGVWTTTIEAIEYALKRWSRSHPTISGKKLVVNMELGGRVQYPITVQNMPLSVEKYLDKLARQFYWGGKISYVSAAVLELPFEEGGIRSLDLSAKREAIDLMRMKRYLERPRWAAIADVLLAKNIPTQYGPPDDRSAINCFTQNWEAAKQSKKSAAPQYVRDMIKTSRKYGLRLWTNAPSENAKRSLPIWLHVASKRKRAASDANNLWAKCQRDNHKLRTVGDMADYASGPECQTQLGNPPAPDPNSQNPECQCHICSQHRAINCTDPQACRRSAKKLLLSLRKTWIPNPERDEVEELTREKSVGHFPLNRANSIAECFRIFTTSEAPSLTLDEDLGLCPRLPPHAEEDFITIFTDGSGIEVDTMEAAAGGGVFFGEGDPRNEAFRLPKSLPQTNNAAEAAAVLVAVNKADRDTPIVINSDSQITIQAITQLATKIEDSGWIETSNREVLEPLFALLRNRSALTVIKKVKAHSGIHGNERADSLAGEGATQPTSQIILPLTPIAETTTQGARLSTATQGLLYKGIRKIKASKTKARRQTTCHLDIARHEIELRTGKLPTDKAIWTSLKKGHLQTNKRARQLIWKLMHHGLPIGEFWNSITNYEHRAECRECDSIESPEHIFTECKFSGQEIIWKSVKTIFDNKKIPWITPSLGTVLGCGISELNSGPNEQKRPAADRLYTIIIAEATQQIWRTRCDWRMDKGEDPLLAQTTAEIHNKWVAHLNKVLQTDILSSNYKPHKNINKSRMNLPTEETVIDTWWDVVTDNSELEWEVRKKSRRRKVGVLVGNIL